MALINKDYRTLAFRIHNVNSCEHKAKLCKTKKEVAGGRPVSKSSRTSPQFVAHLCCITTILDVLAMMYSLAAIGSLLMGSTLAFTPSSVRLTPRGALRMQQDPWFPNSVTSNTVPLETLKYLSNPLFLCYPFFYSFLLSTVLYIRRPQRNLKISWRLNLTGIHPTFHFKHSKRRSLTQERSSA